MSRLHAYTFVLALGALAAAQSAVPQNRSSFHITGTVVNAITGAPVGKIEVAIGWALQAEPARTFVTAEDGRFDFENLARGKYWLEAHGRGYSTQRFDQHEEYSTAIVVGPNLISEGLMFRLLPEATITGSITDDQNDPVAQAQVMLFRTGIHDGANSTALRMQDATDDQGHYRLSHVPAGNYYIAVSARPWYAQYRPGNAGDADPALDTVFPITFYSGVTEPVAATLLTAKAGDHLVADIGLTAVPSAHLHIRDFGGDMRNGIDVELTENLFGTDIRIGGSVQAVRSGEIDFGGVPPGRYSLALHSSSAQPENVEKKIELSGESEISVADASPMPSVTGIVRFEDGTPLPGPAMLLLRSRSGENLTARVPADGKFEIAADRAQLGKYEVEIFGIPGAFIKSLSATGANLIGREIDLAKGNAVNLTVILSHGVSRLNGTALREGKPFAGAMIVLVPRDIEHNSLLVRRDQSDSDGTFSLLDVLPGSYTVVAIQNGWNLPWLNPDVIRPYLSGGTVVNISARERYDIKVTVQ